MNEFLLQRREAAAFMRYSVHNMEKVRLRADAGLMIVKLPNGHNLYPLGGLLAYCQHRKREPDWSVLRPRVPLDAGRRLPIAARAAREHVQPRRECRPLAPWLRGLLPA